MTQHPDIGKRVKWRILSEEGYGKLMAVDCDTAPFSHLVQREDGGGWELEPSCIHEWHTSARSQGVKDGTKNLYWVCSYEVVPDNKPVAFASNKNAKELGIDTSREFVVVDATGSPYLKEGDIFRLDRDDQSDCPYFRRVPDGYINAFRWDRFAYAPQLDTVLTFTNPNPSPMNIIKQVRDHFLPATDKTLRKHGFENDCGEMTQEARDYVLDLLLQDKWKKVRTKLAEDIVEVEKED